MTEHTINRNGRFSAPLRTPIASIPDADPIYREGDTVMHPSEGVCVITEIRSMQLGAEARYYYILKPHMEKSSSTVYLPVSRGNTLLRRLLSREDILALIHKSAQCKIEWNIDSKLRKEAFSRILSEGDHAKIIRMICEIHAQNALREREGKRLCASDEAILNEAKNVLHQEFSYVLHLSLDETAAFIMHELNTENR